MIPTPGSRVDAPLSDAACERLHSDVAARLEDYRPRDRESLAARDRTLAFLARHPRAVDGTYAPGHVTATAVVLSADGRRVLLTLHRRIGAWLELGGHLEEADAGLAAAALREAREEGGIEALTADEGLVAAAVYENLPCRRAPGTDHYDLYFRMWAPPGAEPVISDESIDLGFFDLDRLPRPLGDGVDRIVTRAAAVPR